MGKILAVVGLALLGGCATIDAARLAEPDILKLVERDSYDYCHTGSRHGYTKTGCKFNAMFIDGEWSVIAHSIYSNEKGEILALMGADMLYIYSPSGQLLRKLPGM